MTGGVTSMKSSIAQLLELGRIPADGEMSDELFERYDKLLQFNRPLTEEEAERLSVLFSPDCDGLNWALLRAIESAGCSAEKLNELAEKCPNEEYARLMRERAEKK